VAEVAEPVVEEASEAEAAPADEPAAEESATGVPVEEEVGSEESSDDSK
jgi:hypothetical protein